MTENEAIKEFQQNIDMPFGSNISREASELAIQALEKQIPKKVVKESKWNCFCPCCGESAYTDCEDGYYNYSLDYLFGIKNYNEEYLPLTLDLNLIAHNLKILRKKNNYTQEKLAKKLNTNQASYAHYENATNMIPTVFLYNLTTVYKPFSIDKLLGRKKQ